MKEKRPVIPAQSMPTAMMGIIVMDRRAASVAAALRGLFLPSAIITVLALHVFVLFLLQREIFTPAK
jgi:hypothetical protein